MQRVLSSFFVTNGANKRDTTNNLEKKEKKMRNLEISWNKENSFEKFTEPLFFDDLDHLDLHLRIYYISLENNAKHNRFSRFLILKTYL